MLKINFYKKITIMGWIETIAQSIEKAFNAIRKPLGLLPPILLLCEIYKRPGLSCVALTGAIIKGLEEIGIPTGANNDGTPSLTNQLVKTIACGVIDEFQNNCVVEGVLGPGQISSTGTGANAAGPVVVTVLNTLPISFRAITR